MQSKHLPAGTVSPFQAKIYALVQQIPEGRVCSYAALARAASSTTATTSSPSAKLSSTRASVKGRGTTGKCSPRAVGGALRRNPFAPEVPCHRVLGSTGFIAGFKGSWDKTPSTTKDLPGMSNGGLGITQNEKRALLKEEGVEFDERGFLLDAGRKWWDGFDVGKL
ncbi:unnamed protein product [Periconia digitata]|uniref:Methylated-DNA--protein-cysteine methyltransferase n=1 Tax=Periconia digitata TaxID=1303443 RepID=A0A9W4XWH2_9PLEO|nr:unnamed protein product [Periconia digitata]